MNTFKTQYLAAWTRARIQRRIHGPEGYAAGMLAAQLRGDGARRGYIDGWCSQDDDEPEISLSVAGSLGSVRL